MNTIEKNLYTSSSIIFDELFGSDIFGHILLIAGPGQQKSYKISYPLVEYLKKNNHSGILTGRNSNYLTSSSSDFQIIDLKNYFLNPVDEIEDIIINTIPEWSIVEIDTREKDNNLFFSNYINALLLKKEDKFSFIFDEPTILKPDTETLLTTILLHLRQTKSVVLSTFLNITSFTFTYGEDNSYDTIWNSSEFIILGANLYLESEPNPFISKFILEYNNINHDKISYDSFFNLKPGEFFVLSVWRDVAKKIQF